jgi:hypothetical protein
MDYLAWNNLIARHFFGPEKAGRRIHLHVTRELINTLGGDRGMGVGELAQACKSGPPWAPRATKPGLCNQALACIRGWRGRDLEHPPYLAYLALFVAAASMESESESEFAVNAYYPRLRKLLGESGSGAYPDFDGMGWLWEDLERWSNVDKGGEWGVFHCSTYVKWKHVGPPMGQTLLSAEDSRALPRLFALASLDPSSPPSEGELATILCACGQGHLRPRTLRWLEAASTTQRQRSPEGDAGQALVELLGAELRAWDGVVPAGKAGKSLNRAASVGQEDEEDASYSGTLRLCLSLDRVSGQARTVLRCKVPDEFPEDGFLLAPPGSTSESGAQEFALEEWSDRWSKPLRSRADGQVVDASTWDWSQNWTLEDQAQGWTLRWRAAPLHLLADGRADGLTGYVEAFRLPHNAPMLLVARADAAGQVDAWGRKACQGWREIVVSRGLPQGWRMFEAQQVSANTPASAPFPVLRPSSSVSLAPRGGIRKGRGNHYFHFALPTIEAQATGDIQVLCNGHPLTPDSRGLYPLPAEVAPKPDGSFEVQALRGGDVLGRMVFFVAYEGWEWAGVRSTRDNARAAREVAGAVVRGEAAPPFDFDGVVALLEEGTVHYVGRQPGQVAHWPKEPRPTQWKPVWVITSRRRGEAVFCGTDAQDCVPVKAKWGERRAQQKWRELLWFNRKDVTPPSQPELKKLWAQYQEVARDG